MLRTIRSNVFAPIHFLKPMILFSTFLLFICYATICYSHFRSNCSGRLVIATATGYRLHDIQPFVLSYNFSVSRDTKLMLLLSSRQRRDTRLMLFLSRYDVEMIFIDVRHSHIGNYRFIWIQKYLTDSLTTYCSIFCTDLRDAYFQGGSFFEQVEQFGITQFGIKSTEEYVLLAQGLTNSIYLTLCHTYICYVMHVFLISFYY